MPVAARGPGGAGAPFFIFVVWLTRVCSRSQNFQRGGVHGRGEYGVDGGEVLVRQGEVGGRGVLAGAVGMGGLGDRDDVAVADGPGEQELGHGRALGLRDRPEEGLAEEAALLEDRKSTRLNSSHVAI